MLTRIYIGVDISKDWFDVCTSLDEKAPVERYLNNPDGHARFIKAVSVLARKVHMCMEYTGGYETPLALACRAANLTVSLIDGGKFSTYRKSFGRARAKTDKQDARLLARFGAERRPPEWFPAPDEYRTLRELVRHRQSLLEAKTQWGCRASHSVQSELVSSQRQALRQVLGLQVKEADKTIAAHIQAHPNLEQARDLLVSIPGIAKVAAARILAESGPISNYKSARQYAMAAGLSPIVLHSGQKTPPGKLPVYGNADLRCALFLPVVSSMSHKTGVWDFMQRVGRSGDKLKMTLIVAGMRKLAHIVYGVLARSTKFDKTKL
jgi:transposase